MTVFCLSFPEFSENILFTFVRIFDIIRKMT